LNGRDRCLAALNLEEPDIVPIAEINPGNFNPEELKLDGLSVYPATPEKWGYSRRIDAYTFIDEWGIKTRIIPETGAIAYIDAPIKSPEDLDRYEPPDVDALSMKPIEEASRRVGRKMLLISGIGMEGTMSFQLMGFNRFLTSLYREPSFVEKVLDMVLEFAIELGRKMASAGVDAIWLGDDYAGIKGLFLSPDMMRRYVFPRLRRIVTALKREGVYVIKHTDGDVSLILKDLIDAGIDAINPIQPECMDIQEVKQKYRNMEIKYAFGGT
jgi:uroporphyrinogen decarboxylase